MKPDWKDAPEWANWLAMDEDGTWCWYEDKPHKLTFCWNTRTRWILAKVKEIDWSMSLKKRPQS